MSQVDPRQPPLSRAIAAWLRPGSVALLAAALAVQATGWTRGTDETVLLVALHQLAPEPHTRPLVVAIDGAALEALGPPPWSDEAWQQVEAALARQGLERAVLVEPWPLMVRADQTGPTTLSAARVHRDGTTFEPPARATPALDLPRPQTPWWWVETSGSEEQRQLCAWGADCTSAPGARTPLRWVEPTHLPLSSVLTAEQAWLHAGDGPVLLGLTAPGWTHPTMVGTAGGPRPWVDALAAATASAIDGEPVPAPERRLQLGWLVLLFVLAALLPDRLRRAPWSWLGPPLVVAPALLAASAGLAALPVITAVLAFSAPLIGEALDERVRRDALARHLALLTVRSATRAGVPRERINSHEALPSWLHALSLHHLDGARYVWLALTPGARQLTVTYAEGLGPADFGPGITDPQHPDLNEARHALHGARSTRLVTDEALALHLVPLRQADEVVGYWGVLLPREASEPSLPALSRLARWVESQLALPGHPGAMSLDGTSSGAMDDSSLQRLHLATERLRSRDEALLQGLGVPVLLADTAGRLVQHNDAMRQALAAASLEGSGTLGDLLHRLATTNDADRALRTVFHANRTAELRWPGDSPATLYLRPIAPQDGQPIAGVCVWLEQHPQQVRWRAARDTLRHTTRRMEDRLSHLLVATDLLDARNEVAAARPLLTTLRQEARTMEAQTAALRELFERDWQPGDVPIDLHRLLREEVDALAPELHQRGLQFEPGADYLGPLGHGEPFSVQHGMQALLRTLVLLAHPGAALRAHLDARDRGVCLRLDVQPRLDEGLDAVLRDPHHAAEAREDLRGLSVARAHLPELTVQLEHGHLVATLRLPQVPER